MLDRRQLLCSAAASSWALGSLALPFGKALPFDFRLERLFDSIMNANLDASPEGATALGLDTGSRAGQRYRLDDRSLAFLARTKHRIKDEVRQLLAFDRASLRGMDRVNYDVVLFGLRSTDTAYQRYDYGAAGPGVGAGAGAPYVISPLTGAYSTVPDFLDGQHQIASKADADAYLARLAAFAAAMDQEIAVVRHDMARGCTPPDFALAKTLLQMMALRSAPPADAGLVTSVARRAREKNVPGNYVGAAATIVAEKVYPALDRQIALVKQMQAQATHDAGVWKLEDGDAYYADALIIWTTSRLRPVEIHKSGLAAVADYSARIDRIMKQQGMTNGTVAERLRGMFADPAFHYSNTAAGRDKLLADLNAKVRIVRAKLPQYFGVLPKADVVVKRVPQYMEAARPSGYYEPPSLDGQRPGTFYVNLRDLTELPTWKLPTQTYHSSIPGHHLKFAIYQQTNLPLIRKSQLFSAYLEGWSFYAEHLADEMGMYDNDPFGRIGYLHGALRASVGLVVDTGIHAMRWSRERGINLFTETLGEPVASATTEVERYCIWPGQVCSYMVHNLTLLELRNRAKAVLGPRFDIRQFHDAVLLCGAVPLTVLETVVDNYIKARTA